MHGSLPGLAAGRFGVIMFFSACRLPSFAPEDPPSHASENQITTGGPRAVSGVPRESSSLFIAHVRVSCVLILKRNHFAKKKIVPVCLPQQSTQ